MNRDMLAYIVVLVSSVFISALSQVLLKKSSMHDYGSCLKEYLNPLVIIAYTLFIGSTFLTIFSYKRIPLSMGPVFEATSYIYVTIFGVKIFDEKVNRKKAIGLICIMIGIVVYSFG